MTSNLVLYLCSCTRFCQFSPSLDLSIKKNEYLGYKATFQHSSIDLDRMFFQSLHAGVFEQLGMNCLIIYCKQDPSYTITSLSSLQRVLVSNVQVVIKCQSGKCYSRL